MTFRMTVERPTRRLAGIGLHSGTPSSVRILPSESNGICFRERSSGQEIEACVANVFDTQRCTMLHARGITVQTVEHVLSALAGVGVTDAIIEFEGVELPALDGSSLPYVEALLEAEIGELPEEIAPIVVIEPITVVSGSSVMVAVPSQYAWISVTLEYTDRPDMSNLSATWRAELDYGVAIAPARTFGFVEELEWLRARGLGLGVSTDNVVAFAQGGAVDPRTPMRFINEPARHKVLDIIGDLSLCGRPIQCGIVAFRPSHALNVSLAADLARLAPIENQGDLR